jgi:hypothetical protein
VSVTGTIAIHPDRTFSVDAAGEGTDRIKVTGIFDGAGTTASGTFEAHVG